MTQITIPRATLSYLAGRHHRGGCREPALVALTTALRERMVPRELVKTPGLSPAPTADSDLHPAARQAADALPLNGAPQPLGGRVAVASIIRPNKGPTSDLVAIEEPLEIRIAGQAMGVVIRTPGDDEQLVLGLLFSEGIITSAADVAAVAHCGRPGEEGYGNTVEVSPASGAGIRWDRLEARDRNFSPTSACGICGARSIAEVMSESTPIAPGPVLPASAVSTAVAALRSHQSVFSATGGTHAAAFWTEAGALIAAHEDVGRHNAVDKVVGSWLLAREEARIRSSEAPVSVLLVTSGRAGFEVVQKAVRARVPVVACVSAPTSLAVKLAAAAGVTLAAFVRGEQMNVYTGAERIGF